MRKIILLCIFVIVSFFTYSAQACDEWIDENGKIMRSWDPIECGLEETQDNSIQQELDKLSDKAEEFSGDFTLKTFSSCAAMDEVMNDYIKDYWENNKSRWDYRYYPTMDFMVDDITEEAEVQTGDAKSVAWGDDFSTTNTQIQWVDESDIIKTDGRYVYYFNNQKKSVFIIDVQDKKNLKLVKQIKIPNNIYSPVLYIDNNRLIIVWGWYIDTNKNTNSWGSFNSKTFTIIFDTSDKSKPVLLKMFVSDGNFSKSRKIWDYLYLLSNKSFDIPYYDFTESGYSDFESSRVMPKSLELTKTQDISKQNTTVNNKKYPYQVTVWDMVDCNEISYSFPDKETFQEVEFSPNFNIISAINIVDVQQEVQTDIIAWNSAEIFMSQENLYITDRQYIKNNFRCAPGMMCIQPFFFWGENTIVHKLNIDKQNVDYQTSALIPGSPLNQYSMDEHEGNFRIITQKYSPEKNTAVHVLDENLELLWSLDWLGKTEDFKSSRFMWDKLFLVTFEQIDPFYVIDMSDDSKPKVLWELKIPWYSTYLHPYDENHIIWIGYDTTQNQWWGTINDGIKLDLYEIDYNRAPAEKIEADENGNFQENLWDIYVVQKFTQTIGEYGSSSEATYNPRMFMWNANKKTLLLPAKVFINEPTDRYKRIDFYQWLYAFNIDANTWISQKYKVTHIDFGNIEEKRLKECSKYSASWNNQVCKELIDGTMYCTQKTQTYVPTYCYADASIWEYKARYSYNYANDYIKRALWIWDAALSISNNAIMTSQLDSGLQIDMLKFD